MFFGTLYVTDFVLFAVCLFVLSSTAFLLHRRNLLMLLISLELMMLSSIILFVSLSSFRGNAHGHIVALMILTVAAAEAALGLALMITHYRRTSRSISLDNTLSLRG